MFENSAINVNPGLLIKSHRKTNKSVKLQAVLRKFLVCQWVLKTRVCLPTYRPIWAYCVPYYSADQLFGSNFKGLDWTIKMDGYGIDDEIPFTGENKKMKSIQKKWISPREMAGTKP